MLIQLHLAAAWVVMALAGVWLVSSLLRLGGLSRIPDTIRQAPTLALTLALVAAFSGIAVFLTGHRPKAGLHLLYGVAIVLAAPLMRALALSRPARGPAYEALGALLVLGLGFRLFATG